MIGLHHVGRYPLALVAIVVALGMFACAASDGGVGGTGIATVQGNVVAPVFIGSEKRSLLRSERIGVSLAGFVVRVQSTNIEDVTDDNGLFIVEGLFSGDITLEFWRDDLPMVATVPLFVSVGSEVTLTNVEIIDGAAAAEEIRVERLVGDVVGDAICDVEAGSFGLEDEGGLVFTVAIDADTMIRRQSSGDPLACHDLTPGSWVKIRGLQQDRHIIAVEIRILKFGDRPAP